MSDVQFSISLTPKKLFWGGFLIGLAVIGLIVLVTIVVVQNKGGNITKGAIPAAVVPTVPPADDQAVAPPPGPTVGTVKPVSEDEHIYGNASKAEVFLIEYSDLECPFCQRFHGTAKEFVDSSNGAVAWVYRHFPLSFHANAQKEAEASECAADLGGNTAFWKYIDAIFERTTANGTGFPLSGLAPLAKELGLNEKKFTECLDSGKFAEKVQRDLSEGTAANVNGTPGNILWTREGKAELIPGAVPLTVLQAALSKFK